jgi:hypothetical protein
MEQRSLHARPDPPLLQGRLLVSARLAWITTALLVVMLSFVGFWATFHYLDTVCTVGAQACSQGAQLTPAAAQELQSRGISLTFYTWYILAFEIFFVLVWFAVALLIFWRKSQERMAWFASFALLTFCFAFTDASTNYPGQSLVWWELERLVSYLGANSLVLLLYLFPTGSFVPRWTRFVGIGWLLWNVPFMLVLNATTNRLWAIAYIVVLALGIFAQVYRYRRISTPLQKQQTKWAVFGFAIALGGFLMLIGTGLWLVQLLPPFLRGHALSQLIIQPLYYLFVLIIPLFIGLAILRSRLWEIDVLINRTLVYGLLTAILLGTYLLLVFGGQYLLASLLGPNNPVVLVVSTLVVAALAGRLRQRVQVLVDRRFYRRKYDANRIIAAFGAALQAELNLEQLRQNLLQVVTETMQPTHVSLWFVAVREKELRLKTSTAFDERVTDANRS